MTLDADDLVPECARCAALCCVAFAFDRSDEFSHDKAGDEPCHHLGPGFSCTIHDRLAASGYGGCVRFDCHGAGQRVVQDLFGGADWRSNPGLKAPMMAAFRAMRRIHELVQLLLTADALTHDSNAEAERQALLAALDPDEGWTQESLAAFERGPLARQIQAFLRSLTTRADPV